MELYTMRYVLAVAEHENFSLAAQACHVGQPALSQQVARLEKELKKAGLLASETPSDWDSQCPCRPGSCPWPGRPSSGWPA